ncbi:MAG: GH25 family lysozyme [Planctomycetota bacterium]
MSPLSAQSLYELIEFDTNDLIEPYDISNTGLIPSNVDGIGDFSWTYSRAINDSGYFVGGGFYDDGEGPRGVRAFLHDGQTLHNLGALNPDYRGSGYSEATDINNNNRVVGSSIHDQGREAFVWLPGVDGVDSGTMLGLGKLGTANTFGKFWDSEATAINDQGVVAGWSEFEQGGSDARAFTWTLGGGMIDRGSYRGDSARAVDINNNNQVLAQVDYRPVIGSDLPVLQFNQAYAASNDFQIGPSPAAPSNGPTFGVDVSHWQGSINWQSVWGTGKDFSIIKATEHTGFVDEKLAINAQRGTDAGMAMGAYHFARPSGQAGSIEILNDAFAEADHFSQTIAPYIQQGQLQMRPVLDLEVKPDDWSWSDLSHWADAFMQRVQVNLEAQVSADPFGFGGEIKPILYTPSDYAHNLDESLTEYDLWIAHWTYDPNETPDIGKWDDWAIWQYSDQTAVEGVAGDVDGNILNDNAYGLADLLLPGSSAPDKPQGVIDDLDAQAQKHFGFGVDGLDVAAINNEGHVVGSRVDDETGFTKAVLYDGSQVVDLDLLVSESGWQLRRAHGINDQGSIIGEGVNPEGELAPFVLQRNQLPADRPSVVQVDRTPSPTLMTTARDPSSDQMVVLGDGELRNNRPTIVLSHGWNSQVDDHWPDELAALVDSRGSDVNLVAWDWSDQADTGLLFSAAGSRTPQQGRALADALSDSLGSDYEQQFHFIGHSFGALVNRNAIDQLHEQGFDYQKTQVTILDSADLGLNGNFAWTGAVPDQAAAIENYISAFGSWQDEAVNIYLTEQFPISLSPSVGLIFDLADYHAVPTDWYGLTVQDPDAAPVGYGVNLIDGDPDRAAEAGSAFIQTLNPFDDPIFINSVSESELRNALTARNVLYGLQAVALTANLLQGSLIQITGDVAIDFVTDQAADALKVTLRENSPAYAWIPIVIPQDADYLSIDFTFSNLDPEDELVIGINDHILFQLDAESVAGEVTYSTGLLDISVWDETTAELFLGLISTGASGGSIVLENFDFYSFNADLVPEPGVLASFGLLLTFLHRRRSR